MTNATEEENLAFVLALVSICIGLIFWSILFPIFVILIPYFIYQGFFQNKDKTARKNFFEKFAFGAEITYAQIIALDSKIRKFSETQKKNKLLKQYTSGLSKEDKKIVENAINNGDASSKIIILKEQKKTSIISLLFKTLFVILFAIVASFGILFLAGLIVMPALFNGTQTNSTLANLTPSKPPEFSNQNYQNPAFSQPPTTTAQMAQYKSLICDKIEPYNSLVRNTAVQIASSDSGTWNVNQLVDLYLWMKNNISYVSAPVSGNYNATASETIADKGGNCEDQAILIASLIRSVGGTAKVVVVPNCEHAFAIVFISSNEKDFENARTSIRTIYYNRNIYDLSNEYFEGYQDNTGYVWSAPLKWTSS